MPVMTVVTGEWDEAVAGLRTDPAVAGLLGPDALALVWELSGERLLWSSPAAVQLARALADDEGRIYPDLRFSDWLRTSGRTAAPVRGIRLERVRLGTDRIASPTMLACRRLSLGTEEALLTVVIGPAPVLRPRPLPAPEPDLPDVPLPTPGKGSEIEPRSPPEEDTAQPGARAAHDACPVEDLRALPVRRFVWEMDAGGRFTAMSESLAEVVGTENADVLGRRWSDIVGRLILDPTNGVGDALAAEAAWSNRPVLWRLADGHHLLPVAMSGAPVRGAQRSLEGFRGFGIRRPSEIVADPDAVVAVETGVMASEAEPEWPVGAAEQDLHVPPATEPQELQSVATLTEVPTQTSDDTAVVLTDPTAPETAASDDNTAAVEGVDSEPQHEDEPAASPMEPAAVDVDAGPAEGEASDGEPPRDDENGFAMPETAVEPPPVKQRDQPTEPPGYTYPGTSQGLIPVFQVLLDASLSGLSNMFAALPSAGGRGKSATDPESPDRSAAAESPPDEVGEIQEPEIVEAEAQAEVAADELPATEAVAFLDAHEMVALQGGQAEFGVLHARVGGQLGGSRPVPLRLPSEPDVTSLWGVGSVPQEAEEARPILSFAERGALHEIARALGARIEGPEEGAATERRGPADIVQIPQQPRIRELARLPDQIPLGLLVHRGEAMLYANRFLLDLAGADETGATAASGDVPALFARGLDSSLEPGQPPATALIMGPEGSTLVECRAAAIEWGEVPASLQLVTPLGDSDPALRMRALELDVAQRDRRLDEIAAILDLATDGIVILDASGCILSLNPGAERLLGFEQTEVAGEPITSLLAPESHAPVLAAIEGLTGEERAATGVEAREVTGRTRAGKPVPLSIVFGSVGTTEPSVCVVIRDVSRHKELAAALAAADQKAEHVDRQRTEFLAQLSHEIRTPLDAIIGFAELMIEERFGAAGTERYQSYLNDIRESGQHVIGLLNDLLDLSRASSGEIAAAPEGLDLNAAVAEGVAALQPLAARERIVVRTSFASGLAPVLADEASLRQIVTNVLSHAIGRSDAGGQIIASTAVSDSGDIAFRVRDTGRAMSAEEIEAPLEPFRQVPTARRGNGAGLDLPLAKALVKAHGGGFAITSRPHEGTLVEVVLPTARVALENA